MSTSYPQKVAVRFGGFELDHSGELRSKGRKIKLQDQPIQILQFLIERHGQIVTREELRARIWPSDTFVDFDHGINNAIKRLREALGDTAETPRFIETLPRRGYRFIGAVEVPLESSHTSIESIAVLPLENLSRDPEQEYFTDGLTEALITSLAKIGALRVASRTTAMHYKGVHRPVREIARELGVDAVVEGSVLRSGGRVRISVQLIDARKDSHLWAESYERDLQNVLTLHSDIARSVATEIQIKLTPKDQQRRAAGQTADTRAFLDGSWALNDPAKQDDWLFRAVHVIAVADETITRTFYAADLRSYFAGCSDGGREGLIEAEKYPADFNGIIAGDPLLGDGFIGFNWNEEHITASPGSFVSPDKMALVGRAVLNSCDAADGVLDGLIQDPRKCSFDPESLRCQNGNLTNCLTDEQDATLKSIYEGVSTKHDRQVYPGFTKSDPVGTPDIIVGEDGWPLWISAFQAPNALGTSEPWMDPEAPPWQFIFQDQFLKFFVFSDPNYNSLSFDINSNDLAKARTLIHRGGAAATNPDLSGLPRTWRQVDRLSRVERSSSYAAGDGGLLQQRGPDDRGLR